MVFLLGMVVAFIVLCVWTQLTRPDLWQRSDYWLSQLPKLALMMTVSTFGGLLCRYLLTVGDGAKDKGYIHTAKHPWFRVNYTRKLQHFMAYLIPLVFEPVAGCSDGPLFLFWGDFFTLLGFLVFIKPLRENCTFFMIQFNALDRPEDRPHTLKWIIGGNIVPGLFIIVFFRWLFAETGINPDLALIFVFITGLGDGFAEPVGIWLGKHKYKTRSCADKTKYTRSWEGSACVWMSGLLFTTVYYASFPTQLQFWTCALIIAPVETLVEATSPHTMDTAFLMSCGGLIIYTVIRSGI
jgi:dolichol kinase